MKRPNDSIYIVELVVTKKIDKNTLTKETLGNVLDYIHSLEEEVKTEKSKRGSFEVALYDEIARRQFNIDVALRSFRENRQEHIATIKSLREKVEDLEGKLEKVQTQEVPPNIQSQIDALHELIRSVRSSTNAEIAVLRHKVK